jgi:hypothetical protein
LVDLSYELGGSLIALTYISIGVVFYHFSTGKPELKCTLPKRYFEALFFVSFISLRKRLELYKSMSPASGNLSGSLIALHLSEIEYF